MGDARSRCTVTAFTAVVLSALTTVANRLAGMIAGQPFTVSVAVGTAVMIRVAMAAAHAAAMAATRTAAMATAVSTTSAPSVTATASITTATATAPATATATALFRLGAAPDGQGNGEQWRSCKHQGAGKDCKETLIL